MSICCRTRRGQDPYPREYDPLARYISLCEVSRSSHGPKSHHRIVLHAHLYRIDTHSGKWRIYTISHRSDLYTHIRRRVSISLHLWKMGLMGYPRSHPELRYARDTLHRFIEVDSRFLWSHIRQGEVWNLPDLSQRSTEASITTREYISILHAESPHRDPRVEYIHYTFSLHRTI